MGFRRKLAVLLVAAASAFGAAALAPSVQAVALSPAAPTHSCSGSYTHAHLPWGQK
jgi:hypothetical protein